MIIVTAKISLQVTTNVRRIIEIPQTKSFRVRPTVSGTSLNIPEATSILGCMTNRTCSYASTFVMRSPVFSYNKNIPLKKSFGHGLFMGFFHMYVFINAFFSVVL